jgi:hypothetical protein
LTFKIIFELIFYTNMGRTVQKLGKTTGLTLIPPHKAYSNAFVEKTIAVKRSVGRPRKVLSAVKRSVGRPRKVLSAVKRPVGRPRKGVVTSRTTVTTTPISATVTTTTKRSVGRPRKSLGVPKLNSLASESTGFIRSQFAESAESAEMEKIINFQHDRFPLTRNPKKADKDSFSRYKDSRTDTSEGEKEVEREELITLSEGGIIRRLRKRSVRIRIRIISTTESIRKIFSDSKFWMEMILV